ncbi:T9SS type A sorting domain-containing protein, partial [bacterium]|nr:T9SS type A sorting domain-containing protein [bacterium]
FSNNYSPSCSGTTSNGPDAVYSYASPVDQNVTFSTCASGYDDKLFIYDGTCSGAPMACNENSPSCANTNRAHLECLPLLAGHTYYIVVDGRAARGEEDDRCTCGNYTLRVFVCGEPPFDGYDMGDLQPCNYPTLVANPAHGLSGIAWLGANVSPETAPNSVDLDLFDDGVEYLNPPWRPCTMAEVKVIVTAGPNYAVYADTGGVLYLNGWKDGNLDGDFDDELSCAAALVSEWIVQDLLVAPGTDTLSFPDPGVFDLGIYEGVFRWRLTHAPVGRYGYGIRDTIACPNMSPFGGTATDYLGEVEDYIVGDLQLLVELGRFEAIPGEGQVTLRWQTLSEADNDRFEIVRDGIRITDVRSHGDSPIGHDYTFVDRDVFAGTNYTYMLYSVDMSGARSELATASASPSTALGTVTEYALHQNYPNPFNPTTTIGFDLPEGGIVSLSVYNVLGHRIAEIVNGYRDAGRHEVSFDATGLPTGVYWCKLEVNSFSTVRKMTLMR